MPLTDLSTQKVELFDNLSEVRDPGVHLGQEIQTIIDAIQAIGAPEASKAEEETPVNAAKAVGILTISSVSVHGETVTIGDDIFEFLADDDQIPTRETNIPVDITSYTVKAHQTLTITDQPTSGNKMTIGTKVYTFVPDGTDTADGEISIGTDLSTAQAAIVAAINGDDEFNQPHPLVTASAFETNICTITAIIGGTAGNTIATTGTFTAETNEFGDTSLKDGGNCSGANTVDVLTDAINDPYGGELVVVASAGSGKIDLEAVVAGAAGNAIQTTTTMAHGIFGAEHLEEGVDGTVADAGKIYYDDSWLYIAVDDNTIVDANWRQITLGAAY